jgi:hypothetical protein
MPLSVTTAERKVITALACLVILGLIGMAVL